MNGLNIRHTEQRRPRFGWMGRWQGHQSIENLALAYLSKSSLAQSQSSDVDVFTCHRGARPEANPIQSRRGDTIRQKPACQAHQGLRDFWSQHLDRINFHSRLQDVEHKGPHHAVNPELLGDSEKSRFIDQDCSFERVTLAFSDSRVFGSSGPGRMASPSVDQAVLRDFTMQPLCHDELKSPENVYGRILQHYGELVEILALIREKPPLTRFAQEMLSSDLEKILGQLSHYVGDLTQPLHATAYRDWPLAYAWEQPKDDIAPRKSLQSFHLFMEFQTYNKTQFNQQRREVERSKKAPQRLSLQEIQRTLLREIEIGNGLVGDLVRTDLELRVRQPDQDEYFSALRQALRPVVKDRIDRAAQLLADLTYSAYCQAGTPDLSALG